MIGRGAQPTLDVSGELIELAVASAGAAVEGAAKERGEQECRDGQGELEDEGRAVPGHAPETGVRAAPLLVGVFERRLMIE